MYFHPINFLLKIIVSAIAVYITATFLPGIRIDDYISALMVALALAFLNTIVKPIFVFLTIPITIFTLGLFLLIINAGIIMLAETLVKGFHVDNILWALLFSLILSVFTGILNALFGLNESDK